MYSVQSFGHCSAIYLEGTTHIQHWKITWRKHRTNGAKPLGNDMQKLVCTSFLFCGVADGIRVD
jgi:hypothetical protein